MDMEHAGEHEEDGSNDADDAAVMLALWQCRVLTKLLNHQVDVRCIDSNSCDSALRVYRLYLLLQFWASEAKHDKHLHCVDLFAHTGSRLCQQRGP